jgi:DNA-binding Xre family transcriptional regulator
MRTPRIRESQEAEIKMARINKVRELLLGGEGAPDYAPNGLLTKRDLTVEQLANRAGISRTSVYFYLERKCFPTTVTFKRICAALEIPFSEGLRYCTPKGYRQERD